MGRGGQDGGMDNKNNNNNNNNNAAHKHGMRSTCRLDDRHNADTRKKCSFLIQVNWPFKFWILFF